MVHSLRALWVLLRLLAAPVGNAGDGPPAPADVTNAANPVLQVDHAARPAGIFSP
jgi:hypothetical protein